jgi:hypothetical protein
MKTSKIILFLIITLVLASCKIVETPTSIIQKTIASIDTLETVYYKQSMVRTNPRNMDETIQRYREMYFQKLTTDSIVGTKGHWYMYIDDKENVIYEDIYDGNRLIRKNNRDSIAKVYDLIKYPELKENHFWSHNTPFSMQYTLKHVLENKEYYKLEKLNDTVIQGTDCFQVKILLENKETMPGFATKLIDSEGSVSTTFLYIAKSNYFIIGVRFESYSTDNPEKLYFTDQTYYDLQYNFDMDTVKQFNTSPEIYSGYDFEEITP